MILFMRYKHVLIVQVIKSEVGVHNNYYKNTHLHVLNKQSFSVLCVFACLLTTVCWLCMFFRVWLLNMHSFNVCLRVCLFS